MTKNNAINTDSGLTHLVNFAYTIVNSKITITTTTPVLDDTIPQYSEGQQIISVAITPKSATNIVHVRFVCSCINNWSSISLYQDTGPNALAATMLSSVAIGETPLIALDYIGVTGTTASTIFSIRAGTNFSPLYINSDRSGVDLFNGTSSCIITIMEYQA